MNRSPSRLLLAGLASAALLGAACSSSTSPGGDAATATDGATGQADAGAEVRIKDFVFAPVDITVTAGTTVTWTNDDFFGHTVTSGEPGAQTDAFDGVLGEVAQAEGMDFSFTFEQTGTYAYYCRFHPSMVGSVTVTG